MMERAERATIAASTAEREARPGSAERERSTRETRSASAEPELATQEAQQESAEWELPTRAPHPAMLARVASPGVGAIRRLAARFALVAFGLYHLPLMLNNYPTLGGGRGGSDAGLAVAWGRVFGQVGLWVARHVFGNTGDIPYALSGDNADSIAEYCRALVAVVVAVVAAVIWSVADRKRPGARWVEEALHVMLRYAIALGLAAYAIAKLYPVQFWRISPSLLDTRIAELTPMELAWVFMKHSRAYSAIAGIMEMAVVVLLCFRRTALFGAMLCVPVMLNVMLVNLCYGVIVKLFAISIVVSALVLVLYDAPQLLDVVVWRRGVAGRPIVPPFRSPRLNRARWAVKALVVGSVLWSCVAYMSAAADRYAAGERTALWGMWDVTSIVIDGRELAQSGEPARWRRVTTALRGISIRFEDDRRVLCLQGGDEAARVLTLTCEDTHQQGELHWTRAGRVLRLDGTFDRHRVSASLTLRDTSEFPLESARFRWAMDG